MKPFGRPVPLKPFLFRTRDGFLLGLAMDPQKGSPCQGCIENWLTDRNVWTERAELSELHLRRDLIAELLSENSAHVFYEISNDGTATRLDAVVFPHPRCGCERTNYIPPREIAKRANFAFSPLTQLKVCRFGTPEGNLWLATAVGEAPLTQEEITTYGVEHDKDAARFRAVDAWLKRAALVDLPCRMERGEAVASEVLQTGAIELLSRNLQRTSSTEGMGIGRTKEDATLDALFNLAKIRTLKKYANSMKNPMLIVGANNWIRTRVPFFILQQYDLHLLFYPNSTQAWVVGLAAFSRQKTSERPIFVFAADADIHKALDQLFFRLLEALRPSEPEGEIVPQETAAQGNGSKLNLWWTHWIYRCPKIALRDVLHLEAYPRSLESWREYFRDGQDQVSILSINHSLFPSQLRWIVKLSVASTEATTNVRNMSGIATWADFQDALA